MHSYELTYLISPDLSAEELKTLQEKINSFLEEGKPESFKLPVKKRLAYPIKKKSEAYLGTLSFYLSPEKLENFEKKLKKEPKILRYLLLKKEVTKKIEIPRIKPETKAPKVKKEKKVELEKIEEKLEEILGK
jgi:ribosomal protein S6